MSVFKKGRRFSGAQIRKYLTIQFKRYKIKLKPTVQQLAEWIHFSSRTTIGYTDGREIKGHIMGEPKNAIQLPKKFRQ